MTDTIFLLVKATIRTTHKTVHEAISDLQHNAKVTVSYTKKVKIKKLELMDYKLK